MKITYTFGKIRLSHKVLTVCQSCDREYYHNLQTSLYDNGFHNMQESKSKWYEWAEKEGERISKEGAICTTCKRAGVKPIPGWTMPPFAPRKPQKPYKPIAKLYLSPSINTLWLCSENESLNKLQCPETGEPLLQLPYSPDNPDTRVKKPFPAEYVSDAQAVYSVALAEYQAEFEQYKKDITEYKLVMQQRKEALSHSSNPMTEPV